MAGNADFQEGLRLYGICQDDLAGVLETDQMSVEKCIVGRRQEDTIVYIQSLVVVGFGPGQDM